MDFGRKNHEKTFASAGINNNSDLNKRPLRLKEKNLILNEVEIRLKRDSGIDINGIFVKYCNPSYPRLVITPNTQDTKTTQTQTL